MPILYEITFEQYPQRPYCRTERFIALPGNFYQLPDGRTVAVEATPAWCRHCGRITPGEKIESPTEIDEKIRHYSTWETMPETLEILAALDARRTWRLARKSPPRCLTCGSPDAVILPVFNRVRHPAGTGWIRVDVLGLASTDYEQKWFTPEGVLIRDSSETPGP